MSKPHFDEDAFHDDPRTKDCSDEFLAEENEMHLQAQTNGEIVRIYDMGGWNHYCRYDELKKLIETKGRKLDEWDDLMWLNEIEEFETDI